MPRLKQPIPALSLRVQQAAFQQKDCVHSEVSDPHGLFSSCLVTYAATEGNIVQGRAFATPPADVGECPWHFGVSAGPPPSSIAG